MPRVNSAMVLATALAVVAGGCATAQIGPTGAVAPTPSAATGYVLSADELELGCKQLSGRMQVRILEIRDYNERMQASGFSKFVQTVASSTFGSSTTGKVQAGTYARDVAMLDAYNAQLKAKGCKSYDLAAELQPKDVMVSPSATVQSTGDTSR